MSAKQHPRYLSVLMLAFIGACYPSDGKDDSTSKSIDNFAQGGVKSYNVCSANIASQAVARDTQISAKDKAYREAIVNSLSAVPKVFLQAFQQVGGAVIATKDAGAICAKVGNNNSEKDLNTGVQIPSCWLQDKLGAAPKIYISAEPAVIHHSMIRAFTYFFTEFFLARAKLPEAGLITRDPRWKTAFNEFESNRESVASAFIKDIDAKNADQANQFRSAYTNDSLKFGNVILAEVLDSCYCSDNTRAVMREQFPNTWKASGCRVQ